MRELTSYWTNDTFKISWKNRDEILIQGPYGVEAIMHGGDFESVLSALCAAYAKGKQG